MGVRERERERESSAKLGVEERNKGSGRQEQGGSHKLQLLTVPWSQAWQVPLRKEESPFVGQPAHGLLSTPHLSKKCLLPPESLGCP